MAIIFIPLKRKQRILFWSILALVILVLVLVLLAAFPGKFSKKYKFNSGDVAIPDIMVNLEILRSNKVKNLEIFKDIELEAKDIGRKEPFIPYY